MAKLNNYKGSLYVGSGFRPIKSANPFPLMEAHDIVVDEDGTRLDEKLSNMAGGGGGGGSNIALDTTLTLVGKAAEAYATGEAIGKVGKKVDDIDEVINDMASGGTGYVKYIQTFEGDRIVKLFIGTEQEYEYLTSEEKEDLLAIITDSVIVEEEGKDEEDESNSKITIKECNYFSGTKITSIQDSFYFGKMPTGKTVQDIISVGMFAELVITSQDGSLLRTGGLHLSASKVQYEIPVSGVSESTNFYLNTISDAIRMDDPNAFEPDYLDDTLFNVRLTMEVFVEGDGIYIKFPSNSYFVVNENGVTRDSLDKKTLGVGSFDLYSVLLVFA